MTTPLRTVDGDLSAADAAEIIVTEGIGSVVVEEPRGVVTKTDLVEGIRDGTEFGETTVSEVMTSPVVTVAPDADVQTVVNRMEDHGLKRLVLSSDAELVGIVTVTDLAATFAVDLDTVIGMFADPASADRPHRYECLDCGHRTTADHRRACPECGGRTRNISVTRE
jgi:signal-transduction protein with cAMP-binding, CBS, and nucleotidyltransferase domain